MLRTGLSALLLLGAWAAAGPSTASAAPIDSTEAPASAALLTAMQRDFGLTEGEAVARLADEKAATALEPKAQRAAGSAFGGSWFDARTGKLVVAVTNAARPRPYGPPVPTPGSSNTRRSSSTRRRRASTPCPHRPA